MSCKDEEMFSYQDDAINNLDLMKDKSFYSTLVIVPTGGGKTRIALRYLYEKIFSEPDGQKALWLGERLSLLKQTKQSFEDWKEKPEAVKLQYFSSKATDYRDGIESDTNFVIFTQQTLSKGIDEKVMEGKLKKWLTGTKTLTVIIDEAHHATGRAYRNVLHLLKKFQDGKLFDNLHIIGLTATPKSSDNDGSIEDIFFHGIDADGKFSTNTSYAYEISINDLIAKGVLSKPYIIKIDEEESEEPLKADLLDEYGEFKSQDALILDKIINVYLGGLTNLEMWDVEEQKSNKNISEEFGQTIIFVSNRKQALRLEKRFQDKGIRCGLGISVDTELLKDLSDDKKKEKSKQAEKDFNDYKNGNLKLIVSVDKLREGIDVPKTQTVFIADHFSNDSNIFEPEDEIKYTQMVGRALRGVKQGGTSSAFIVSFGGTNLFDKILWNMPESHFNEDKKWKEVDKKEKKTEDLILFREADERIKKLAEGITERLFAEIQNENTDENNSEKTKDLIILKETLKTFTSKKYLPEGYYHFGKRYLIIWEGMNEIVETLKRDVPEIVQDMLGDVQVLEQRQQVIEKTKVWFDNYYSTDESVQDNEMDYKKLLQYYLYYLVYFYCVVCNRDKEEFDKSIEYKAFPHLQDYNIPRILWGGEGKDENEIESYLKSEWEKLDQSTRDIWVDIEYYESFFVPKIKRLNNIEILPEVTEEEYFRLRLYREGRKRENLCNMIKQIIVSGIKEDEFKRKYFVDVFGGTGTVTAQMDSLFGKNRVYNEYDVLVANFVYWVAKESKFSERCLRLFEKRDSGIRKLIKDKTSNVSKELVSVQKIIGGIPDNIQDDEEIKGKIDTLKKNIEKKEQQFKKEDEKHSKLQYIRERHKQLLVMKKLLEDENVAEYIKAYLIWYDKYAKEMEGLKNTVKQSWAKDLNKDSGLKVTEENWAYKFLLTKSFPSRKVSGEYKTGIDADGIRSFRKSLKDGWISEFHKKMKGVKISCKDFMEVLESEDANAIYYLDPPYFLTKQYDEGFPDGFHLKMLKWFRETDCKWILSCKSCPTNTQTRRDMEKRVGNKNTSGKEGTTLIRYLGNTAEKYENKWLEHDKKDLTMQEYFRLFLYEPLYMESDEDAKKWGADKSVIANMTSEKKNEGKLFVYHGKKPDEEHAEIMISNIKVPDEHQYILENSGIIMEPFEEFFRPLLEN